MGLLREYLREHCKELSESLERSWDIAFDTWLPAVNTNKDTFNSYPHLRNLEVYADKAATAFKAFHHGKREFLSPLETYVLLASILFHDIGKARGSGDHGRVSQNIIKKNWGLLGIPNEELANTISSLCLFHNESGQENISKQLAALSATVVDPYGTIREREIGALLMLVDHIDGSFIRVVPDFIREDSVKSIIGAFRKKIRGIDIDLEGAMVKIIIGEDGWKNSDEFESNITFSDHQNWDTNIANQLGGQFEECHNAADSNIKDAVEAYIRDCDTQKNIYNKLFQKQTSHTYPLFLLTLVGAIEGDKKDEKNPLPDYYILATILRNTIDNVEIISSIKSTLSSFGLPIRGWVLEYKDHLYNYLGYETFEPIFTKDYLMHTAECMWNLSTQIFAHGSLKYEMLASEMREPNLIKVKRAVKRIAIIASETPVKTIKDEDIITEAIWFSETHWKWNRPTVKQHQSCNGSFIHINDLLENIRSLKDGDKNV